MTFASNNRVSCTYDGNSSSLVALSPLKTEQKLAVDSNLRRRGRRVLAHCDTGKIAVGPFWPFVLGSLHICNIRTLLTNNEQKKKSLKFFKKCPYLSFFGKQKWPSTCLHYSVLSGRIFIIPSIADLQYLVTCYLFAISQCYSMSFDRFLIFFTENFFSSFWKTYGLIIVASILWGFFDQ